jgi:poly(A) polymerase
MNPVILPRAEHPISRKLIDPDALRVMYRLLHGGYQAYLVGGGVRDLLLGRTPKDFDIGTDAHPNEIKRLFRNCRLVGRRFRLAHVHFGPKIVEVSTFRKRSEFETEDEDRLIRSDNTFGTPEDDADRRDFTMNGLFYDLASFSVIDYVGGIEDLRQRVVRSIGDPMKRIPEDPVRILRAVKFAARLGLTVEPTLWKAMTRFAPDIHKCAKPRVLEEIYRLLRGGAAASSFQLLEECGMLRELLPEMERHLARRRHEQKDGDRVFWQYLNALDEMALEGAAFGNSLLLGALAVHILALEVGAPLPTDEERADLAKKVEALTLGWVENLGIARRDRDRLAHMLRAQPFFLNPRGRRFRPRNFVTRHYYVDAQELFALGVRATGLELEALRRWQAIFAESAGEEAEEAPAAAGPRRSRRRRGRGRRRRKNGEPAAENAPPAPAAGFGRPARRGKPTRSS